MYSVYVLREYVNSEDLRSYLEKRGFESAITSKLTGEFVDEDENRSLIQSFADQYLISFFYEGDKFPSQQVFKRIFAEDGIVTFEATFGIEPEFND